MRPLPRRTGHAGSLFQAPPWVQIRAASTCALRLSAVPGSASAACSGQGRRAARHPAGKVTLCCQHRAQPGWCSSARRSGRRLGGCGRPMTSPRVAVSAGPRAAQEFLTSPTRALDVLIFRARTGADTSVPQAPAKTVPGGTAKQGPTRPRSCGSPAQELRLAGNRGWHWLPLGWAS